MNEDKIQLPGFLIAELFKNSLVIAENELTIGRNLPNTELPTISREWYLGSNLRKITLLVSEKEAVYLLDDSLLFLTTILEACKLNLGDVSIINFQNDPLDYQMIKDKLSPNYLLLMGVTAQQVKLPFTVPHFQVQKYDNCQFLLAPSLEKMLGISQEAKLEKSKLWLCLKKMFNV